MMRRTLALAAVILMSGALPVAAACATLPCCQNSHPTAAGASVGSRPGCCGETTCAQASGDTLVTYARSVTPVPPPVIGSTVAHVVPSPVSFMSERVAYGSPPAGRRLATLSVLLI